MERQFWSGRARIFLFPPKWSERRPPPNLAAALAGAYPGLDAGFGISGSSPRRSGKSAMGPGKGHGRLRAENPFSGRCPGRTLVPNPADGDGAPGHSPAPKPLCPSGCFRLPVRSVLDRCRLGLPVLGGHFYIRSSDFQCPGNGFCLPRDFASAESESCFPFTRQALFGVWGSGNRETGNLSHFTLLSP